MGVKFKAGVEVGKDITLDKLREQGFKAFYLAVGASKGTKVGCPGDDLPGVFTGLDFLREVNLSEKPQSARALRSSAAVTLPSTLHAQQEMLPPPLPSSSPRKSQESKEPPCTRSESSAQWSKP